jgi:hypothetical protein
MPELPPELRDLVTRLKEPVPPSADLRERVLAAIRAEPAPRRWRPLAWVGTAALAAAAALVVFIQPGSEAAARPIQFILLAPQAARVAIVGDFNDWDPTATPLQADGSTGGTWSVVVPLRPGRYRYSFVVDGDRWVVDPGAPRAVDDDFGPASSVVTILSRRT